MSSYHTTMGSRRSSSSSSISSPVSLSSSLSSTLRAKRYHPYMDNTHRCRFSDDSVSPSPPPTTAQAGLYSEYTIATTTPAAIFNVDYFSVLPQELIEEIGLLACTPPSVSSRDVSEDPFFEDRHRLRTLAALCLTSKQFNQIFNHLLYIEPLVIDTQCSRTSPFPNSAARWSNLLCYEKAQLAKRFTLWRPRFEEANYGQLSSVNPFAMITMLTNIRELTLSGNFRSAPPTTTPHQYYQGYHSSSGGMDRRWIDTALLPKYVPHLRSVRILDVDDAQIINVLLNDIAHTLTSLEIHPAQTGISDDYSPRSIFTTLRPMMEKLAILESLKISLPPIKNGVNHCNHAHKLVAKSLSAIPSKDKLRTFSISLPLFDCRTMQWTDDGSDEDEEDEEPKTVDHAWFWMTLQNFLAECTNLEQFDFKGSSIPFEIERKLHSACSDTIMSFTKAQSIVPQLRPAMTPSLPAFVPPVPPPPPPPQQQQSPPPPPVLPHSNTIGRLNSYNNLPMNMPPVFQLGPITPTSWRPMVEPYAEPGSIPTFQQQPSHFNIPPPIAPAISIFDFQIPGPSASLNLPPIYGNFQPNSNPWQQQPQREEQTWEERNWEDSTEYPRQEQTFADGIGDYGGGLSYHEGDHGSMNYDLQNQDWDWYIKYDQ